MHILIVGGGKVGYYLAKTLLHSGHRVVIVERDAARCASIAEELNITVIHGDGTDIHILTDAGAEDADHVVALTGRDEENLVICQLAKRYFQVGMTIARVKNPKNQGIFGMLGVDATVSTTAVAAQLIENALPFSGTRMFSVFQQGDIDITEVELNEGSPVVGRSVAELALPEECVLITVIHDGKISFPRGRTVLSAGDRVFAIARRKSIEALETVLLGSRK